MRAGPDELEAAIDRLYQLPVAEFTDARNALAVELKAKGDKEVEKEAPILGVMDAGAGKVLGVAVDTLWRHRTAADVWPREPRGRILLHDPRRTLGADDALVERVVGVAVDVAHLAVAQVDADAAAARAHVAGSSPDLGAHGARAQCPAPIRLDAAATRTRICNTTIAACRRSPCRSSSMPMRR